MPSRVSTRAPLERPPPAVDSSETALANVREDAAHFPGGRATGVAFPRSEAEVAALVRAHDQVLSIGAQSSLTGGATPDGGLVVSCSRMSRILEIDTTRARVEPGVTLLDLQAALDARGLYYPPVPTFTGATVGGTIATNAAGAATFKYGSTRDWVEALTVVLASGEVLELTRGAVRAVNGAFEMQTSSADLVTIPVPTYRMPAVPKRSAGYHAEADMDLIDLFIGSEGTLGIVTEATLSLIRKTWASCLAFVPASTEATALALTGALRELARGAREPGSAGIDIPAIEYIDRRSWALVPPRLLERAGLLATPAAGGALFVQLEVPATMTAEEGFEQIATFDQRPDTPLGRFCQVLARFDALDETEIALPGDSRRASLLLEVREAVPAAVNERVGAARREDPSVEKVAGDVIVPFERLGEMVQIIRRLFERAGLDLALWGHVSDGNLHPNLVPRPAPWSALDVRRGKQDILLLGREVMRLGGCPLAEHGVGRNPIKQALLAELYGPSGIDEMRRVKQALDPAWKLAPGVLFPAR